MVHWIINERALRSKSGLPGQSSLFVPRSRVVEKLGRPSKSQKGQKRDQAVK